MMYQGLAYLEFSFGVYQLTDNRLLKVAELKSEPQVSSIMRWSGKPEQKKRDYVQVAQKAVSLLFKENNQLESPFRTKFRKIVSNLEMEE